MYQGDTLSLFSDYAYYDGNDQMAEARYNVVLKHRGTTLYTDSLNYDRLYGIGYFFEGGKMVVLRHDIGTCLSGRQNRQYPTKKISFHHID